MSHFAVSTDGTTTRQKHTYWREAAEEVLSTVIDIDSIDPIPVILDAAWKDYQYDTETKHPDAADNAIFLLQEAAGAAAYALSIRGAWDKTEILDLLCQRQAKYGPENIAKFGLMGVLVRLGDKGARLENLHRQQWKGQIDFNDESLIDTLTDIIGYYVVAVMNEEGWMHLPIQMSLPMEASNG